MKPNFFPAPADMRAMVKMINDLHAAPADPVVRRRLLLERLCRILKLSAAVSRFFPDRTRHVVISPANAATNGVSNGNMHPPDELVRHAAGIVNCTRQAFTAVDLNRTGAILVSAIPLNDSARVAMLVLWTSRRRQDQIHRDKQIVHLIHSELAWIYSDHLPAMDGQIPGLTPRQRSSLHCLLAGHSEKQIASKLGLSPHTVHVHIKAIYKQLDVSSRAELLARFVPKNV